MDQRALRTLSYGLYVITSSYEGKDAGCIANTLQQVTSSPVQLAITLNKKNYTTQIIEMSKRFTSVVLTQQCEMETIQTFGFQCSKEFDKFTKNIERDEQGFPFPSEHIAARFHCHVVNQFDLGTHLMFIGEVEEATCQEVDEEVMTYAYYHRVKNGGTPKNAPSYQEVSEKQGWRCTICGYIYEGDILPPDYICPICNAPADVFVKV